MRLQQNNLLFRVFIPSTNTLISDLTIVDVAKYVSQYPNAQVSQWAGFNDATKKVKIYHGDIVDVDTPAGRMQRVIIYHGGCFNITKSANRCNNKKKTKTLHPVEAHVTNLVVKGNIYKNVELLEPEHILRKTDSYDKGTI